jgi:hypothetical protein
MKIATGVVLRDMAEIGDFALMRRVANIIGLSLSCRGHSYCASYWNLIVFKLIKVLFYLLGERVLTRPNIFYISCQR